MSTRGRSAARTRSSCRVASMPSTPASGRPSARRRGVARGRRRTASAPSAAVPTTVKSGWVASRPANPVADHLVVVGDDDRGSSPRSCDASAPVGQRGLDEESAGRRRRRCAARRRPPRRVRACRAGRARRRPTGRRAAGPGPVVADRAAAARRSRVAAARRRRRRPARAAGRWSAPPGRSGTRRARRPGRAATGGPRRISRVPAPDGVPRLVEQVGELLQARLRAPVRGVGRRVLAQHAEQPAHLGQRGPRGVADRGRAAARPAAGMPGVVSRAVSACTAIIEMWWATTSCSSRAIRARSPRAVCSSQRPGERVLRRPGASASAAADPAGDAGPGRDRDERRPARSRPPDDRSVQQAPAPGTAGPSGSATAGEPRPADAVRDERAGRRHPRRSACRRRRARARPRRSPSRGDQQGGGRRVTQGQRHRGATASRRAAPG